MERRRVCFALLDLYLRPACLSLPSSTSEGKQQNARNYIVIKKSLLISNYLLPLPAHKLRYCRFCKYKIAYIDDQDPQFLRSFVNAQAKILPRKYSGNCVKHQKRVARVIKRARALALLPYVADNFT